MAKLSAHASTGSTGAGHRLLEVACSAGFPAAGAQSTPRVDPDRGGNAVIRLDTERRADRSCGDIGPQRLGQPRARSRWVYSQQTASRTGRAQRLSCTAVINGAPTYMRLDLIDFQSRASSRFRRIVAIAPPSTDRSISATSTTPAASEFLWRRSDHPAALLETTKRPMERNCRFARQRHGNRPSGERGQAFRRRGA
jgi:hypothetical protein